MKARKDKMDEEARECEACEVLGDYMCPGMDTEGRNTDKDGK